MPKLELVVREQSHASGEASGLLLFNSFANREFVTPRGIGQYWMNVETYRINNAISREAPVIPIIDDHERTDLSPEERHLFVYEWPVLYTAGKERIRQGKKSHFEILLPEVQQKRPEFRYALLERGQLSSDMDKFDLAERMHLTVGVVVLSSGLITIESDFVKLVPDDAVKYYGN